VFVLVIFATPNFLIHEFIWLGQGKGRNATPQHSFNINSLESDKVQQTHHRPVAEPLRVRFP
jgi:hypothetical protein